MRSVRPFRLSPRPGAGRCSHGLSYHKVARERGGFPVAVLRLERKRIHALHQVEAFLERAVRADVERTAVHHDVSVWVGAPPDVNDVLRRCGILLRRTDDEGRRPEGSRSVEEQSGYPSKNKRRNKQAEVPLGEIAFSRSEER